MATLQRETRALASVRMLSTTELNSGSAPDHNATTADAHLAAVARSPRAPASRARNAIARTRLLGNVIHSSVNGSRLNGASSAASRIRSAVVVSPIPAYSDASRKV